MILSESSLTQLINKCSPNVAYSTMKAIIKTETMGNPFAIGINGNIRLHYQPKNYQQAHAWVSYLEHHRYNIDIGIAQINIKNIHKYGYVATDMLDPCLNLKVANQILLYQYQKIRSVRMPKHQALFMTISAYNTGNYSTGFYNGYINKVLYNAKN